MPLIRNLGAALILALAGLLLDSGEARAQATPTCDLTVTPFDFGDVSVRDGAADRISQSAQIRCSGGPSNGTVTACINLGAGSGGAGAGNVPRYMRRPDNVALSYQISRSIGGPAWGNEQFALSLNGGGNANARITTIAEIVSQGTGVGGGLYTTSFSGSSLTFSYGTGGACTITGAVIGTLSVRANVVPSCSVSVGAMAFGSIPGNITAPINAQTSLSVTCTNAVPYTIGLGQGLGTAVTNPRARQMMNGTHVLTYGLYKDSGRSAPWGWAGSDLQAATGTASPQLYTIFGQINGGQTGQMGTYTDSVVVTITY